MGRVLRGLNGELQEGRLGVRYASDEFEGSYGGHVGELWLIRIVVRVDREGIEQVIALAFGIMTPVSLDLLHIFAEGRLREIVVLR